jgi:hypothetical protein
MPERHPAGRIRPAMRLETRDAAAQSRKRAQVPFLGIAKGLAVLK